jgi:carbonic anhydrase/acetyltransferase-like protein (isoleucine patch superfamily)
VQRPPTSIDPTAFIATGAVVLGDVTIGRHASIWYNAVVRGDSAAITIGNDSNLQDLSVVHADHGFPCRVGSRVGVGHRAILHGCTVEDESLIGMGAVVLNGVVIGTGSVVGAGAVVREGTIVPSGSLVVGVPARVVGSVGDVLRNRITSTWQHYVELAGRHRGGEFPIHRTD